jgi:hypothetical protein
MNFHVYGGCFFLYNKNVLEGEASVEVSREKRLGNAVGHSRADSGEVTRRRTSSGPEIKGEDTMKAIATNFHGGGIL